MKTGQNVYVKLPDQIFTVLGFSTDKNTNKIAILQSVEDSRIILFIPLERLAGKEVVEINLEEYPEVYSMI
jgi:hypothetical protein